MFGIPLRSLVGDGDGTRRVRHDFRGVVAAIRAAPRAELAGALDVVLP